MLRWKSNLRIMGAKQYLLSCRPFVKAPNYLMKDSIISTKKTTSAE